MNIMAVTAYGRSQAVLGGLFLALFILLTITAWNGDTRNEEVVLTETANTRDEELNSVKLIPQRVESVDLDLTPLAYDDAADDADDPIEITEEEPEDEAEVDEDPEATREGASEDACDEIMDVRRRSLIDNLQTPASEPAVVTKDYLKSENLDNEIDEMIMEPIKYLDNYKNPCWWEHYNGSTSDAVDIRTEYSKLHWHKHRAYDPDTTHPLSSDKTKRLRCAPLFYFIGVSKCATSDLLYYTNLHPMVQAPFIRNFIYWSVMRWVDTNRPIVPFKQYVEIFDAVSHEILRWTSPAIEEGGLPIHPLITGDASPTYAYFFEEWQRLPGNQGLKEPKYIIAHMIRETVPQARIVMNMRNPVDRLYSDYYFRHYNGENSANNFHERVVTAIGKWESCIGQHSVRHCAYTGTFYQYPVILKAGLYFIYLNDWLEVFPREQVHLVRFEDYISDRDNVIDQLFTFLGLDTSYKVCTKDKIVNEGKSKKHHEPMRDDTRELLNKFYRPWNVKLARLLNDDAFLWPDKL